MLGAATFVMIMWNAYYLTAPIWLIAVTRTGGILFGVLVAMLVSNVVFPQSLSASVLEDIATAGEQLAKQSDLLWASILSTKGFDKTARDEHKSAFYEDLSPQLKQKLFNVYMKEHVERMDFFFNDEYRNLKSDHGFVRKIICN